MRFHRHPHVSWHLLWHILQQGDPGIDVLEGPHGVVTLNTLCSPCTVVDRPRDQAHGMRWDFAAQSQSWIILTTHPAFGEVIVQDIQPCPFPLHGPCDLTRLALPWRSRSTQQTAVEAALAPLSQMLDLREPGVPRWPRAA